jgi:vacuolar-type H+-ATPase subunit D/Vma8
VWLSKTTNSLLKMKTAELLKEINTIENELSEVYDALRKERDAAKDFKLYGHWERLVARLGTALDSVEQALKVIDEA